MEKENSNEAKIRKEITRKCVEAQYETAFNYDIYHDLLVWESSIVNANLLGSAINLLKEKKAVEMPNDGTYKGCLVVNLKNMKGIEDELGKMVEYFIQQI